MFKQITGAGEWCYINAINAALGISRKDTLDWLEKEKYKNFTQHGVKAHINSCKNLLLAFMNAGLDIIDPAKGTFNSVAAASAATPEKKYLIIANNHIAAAWDGNLYDTWDSSRKRIKYIFSIEKKKIPAVLEKLGFQPDEKQKFYLETPKFDGPVIVEQETDAEGDEEKAPEKSLDEVIAALKGLEGLRLEICGKWLWITGATYQNRAAIKEAGCKFARKKAAWYYHTGEWHRRGKKEYSLPHIRERYGSLYIAAEEE